VTAPTDDAQWLIGVGALLRAARLEQGATLEEVARVTRISKSQLTAIEDGDVAKLPAMAYVRGFVRIYGGYLGLSADHLLQKPESLPQQSLDPAGEEVAPSGGTHGKGWRRWFAPLCIGVVVLGLAYCYQQTDVPVPSRPPASPQAAPAIMPPPVQLAVSSARTPTVPLSQTTEQSGQDLPPTPVSGAILKLKVNQDCWLNITIDGAFSQQYDLKAGDLIEWKAEESLALDLGNAGGVEAEFNGKPLASFGEPGSVAHIVLKADTGVRAVPVTH
jgi:cytoskeletal protein RodZ